eukprot:CAMPEP_0194508754 /NCGR_PEP_ID=MMETSP0253-20130528/39094_1 /TAXON_ID=2966 /ORGANISM="Noctiluca scintillans" /LENGTH=734 /DNA_ID=CAMNT_0039351825 /DNA_START=17 /DNA_END=2221 /DNA_ORIENTATION=-
MDELTRPLCLFHTRNAANAPAVATAPQPPASTGAVAPLDWRVESLLQVGEECQTQEELVSLVARKPDFVLYDGFEPSGRMHIAQGIFKTVNVNKCTKAGGTFIFWVADWFALMNDKMGGDLEKIKTVGKYLIEVWKASGMDMSRVKFLWSSEEISHHAEAYWSQALDIARRTTLARVKKCCQIMGRKEDSLSAAQILYPIMQCTDIFFLKADICQLGVDQRKVNMLARNYCDAAARKPKPIILSHHMLFGLKAGQAKMSKSDPDSAIFMEDTQEDVRRKIMNAFCPRTAEEGQDAAQAQEDEDMHLVEEALKNPCLDYLKHVLFSREGFAFKVGGTTYHEFESVKEAFVNGAISDVELKEQLIVEINTLLEPVRKHFRDDAFAKEVLGKVTQWKKETLTPTESATRLVHPDLSDRKVFAVFAPLPTELVRLDQVLNVASRLRQAPEGFQSVLWLEDWTAFTLGCLGGSSSCIRAFFELLLHGLRSLEPSLMETVKVCWQGKMILGGPSEYWISVINAGRRCSLNTVGNMLPPGESLENASRVLASLMHVGDVLTLSGHPDTILCTDAYHENLHTLAAEQCAVCKLARPGVSVHHSHPLRLMPEGEGVEADVNLLITDKEIDVNRKLKKAFCEPQNISFCPPIALVSALLHKKELAVTRKPDNGGDKNYADTDSLSSDYSSGTLHPGDLKPAVSRLVNEILSATRPGFTEDDTVKKAAKEMEAHFKSLSKKSQKK